MQSPPPDDAAPPPSAGDPAALAPLPSGTFDAVMQVCEYYEAPDGVARAAPDQEAQLADTLWDSSRRWVRSEGRPVLAPEYGQKYPLHVTYRFPFPQSVFASEGTVPSRAAVLVRLPPGLGRGFDVFTMTYPTVKAMAPAYLPNGMAVLIAHPGERRVTPPTRDLKRVLWRWLGETGGPLLYLIKLEKNPDCDPTICAGYATGDLYPYRMTAAFALVRKA